MTPIRTGADCVYDYLRKAPECNIKQGGRCANVQELVRDYMIAALQEVHLHHVIARRAPAVGNAADTIEKFEILVNDPAAPDFAYQMGNPASSMADVDAANHMLEAIRQMNGAEQAELFAYARHWVSERIF